MGNPTEAVYPCPCCGWIVFEEEPGSYDICPVCGWEDDLSQLRFPEMGGANIPLVEAQPLVGTGPEWEQEGPSPESLGYLREPGWRPLDRAHDLFERPLQGKDYGSSYFDDRTAYYYWRASDATSSDDDDVVRGHYPPADATPAEFEQFVVEVFRATGPEVDKLEVQLHERVGGVDGEYDMDGTVRFRWGGVDFLVLVEAKMHKDPIKRDVVQVLNQKVQSTGAQKGVVVSTSNFQKGALEFAKKHGIALVEVTEGRFTFHTRSATEMAPMTREEAADRGLPTFVGHCYRPADTPGSTLVTVISTEHPEYICELLLGLPADLAEDD